MRTRRAAYYSRNNSYSRSHNAEVAEEEGRLPRSRAAASLGLSVAAFDAGCRAVGYVATEWHHVGKFANRVDYYDCEELADDPKFWVGAANAYKSPKKRSEVLATISRRSEKERQSRVTDFKGKLIAQRDCSRPVERKNTANNWARHCWRSGMAADATLVRAAVAIMCDEISRLPNHCFFTADRIVEIAPHLNLSNAEFRQKTGLDHVAAWVRQSLWRAVAKGIMKVKHG